MMKKHMNPKPPEEVSTQDTTVAFCAKKELEAVTAQGNATVIDEKVEQESTDTMTAEVQFEVLPTELAIFTKPTNKVPIGNGVNISQRCNAQSD